MIYTRFECSFQRSIFDHDTDKKISETDSDKEISETANSLLTLVTSADVQTTLETSDDVSNYTRNEWRRLKLHSKRVKTRLNFSLISLEDHIFFPYENCDISPDQLEVGNLQSYLITTRSMYLFNFYCSDFGT